MSTRPASHSRLFDLASAAGRKIDEQLILSPLADQFREIEANNGAEACSEQLRQLLLELTAAHRKEIDDLDYPDSVRSLIHAEFNRIEKHCQEKPAEWFSFNSWPVRCDLRIACFGRVPVGPQHLEINDLPRSILTRGGMRQGLRFLRTLLRSGGRHPFYALHLDCHIWPPAFARVYSHDTQIEMFHRLAECLEMNPTCRGVFSGGWLFDPQLEFAAPQLAHLRQDWLDHGAELYFWEATDDIVHMATTNSPRRTALHEEGKYQPKGYMVVWLRDELIAWSREHRDRPSLSTATRADDTPVTS